MNKAALVSSVAEATEMPKNAVAKVLDSILDSVVATVASGDSVTLTGFGTFKSDHRAASVKRNPKTQEKVNVPAKNVPKFKAGKNFKEAVA